MKLEDQVCSFEQARKLLSLGLNFDYHVEYYWIDKSNGRTACHRSELVEYEYQSIIPAYTVSELGVLLGKYIVMRYRDDRNWRLYDERGLLLSWLITTDNESQARSSALIWLLEKGYLKAEDLKL